MTMEVNYEDQRRMLDRLSGIVKYHGYETGSGGLTMETG